MATRFDLLAGCVAGVGIGLLAAAASAPSYSFRRRTVVITGGSRGLGLEMAREFAREGARLALLARDDDELERAVTELEGRGLEVVPFVCDLRRRESIEQTVAKIVGAFGRIDVLVNNAGMIQVGPFENMNLHDFESAMAVHFYGPLALTLAVVPHLRRVGGGRIVNITSIAGKIAMPHLLPYTASKFAFVGLSDGLRAELRQFNIRVTTVCPGLMRTGSAPNAVFKGQHRKEYAWFAIADSMPGLAMSSTRAARKIVAACRAGEARLTLGVPAKFAIMADALFPGAVARAASLVNDLLPSPVASTEEHLGFESESPLSRRFVANAARMATVHNNEEF